MNCINLKSIIENSLSKLDDDKDVKIVANDKTILPNVILYDLSLDVAGPDEDKV
jgi:hypothetical protein